MATVKRDLEAEKKLGITGLNVDITSPDFQTLLTPEVERLKAKNKEQFGGLRSLLGADVKTLSSKEITTTLENFKRSLLGGREESEVDESTRTLLTMGSEVAGKITARLQAFEKQQKTPGVQAQTTIANKTTLLG